MLSAIFSTSPWQEEVECRPPILEETQWWVDFSNFFGRDRCSWWRQCHVERWPEHQQRRCGVGSDQWADARHRSQCGQSDRARWRGCDGQGRSKHQRGALTMLSVARGTLVAGGQIFNQQHARRRFDRGGITSQPTTWLPTTLFLGKGNFEVSAGGDLELGPVANVFLLPQAINNSPTNLSYFFHLRE